MKPDEETPVTEPDDEDPVTEPDDEDPVTEPDDECTRREIRMRGHICEYVCQEPLRLYL